MREIDQYILQQPEPAQSCLQALRLIILQHHPNLTEAWKYRMPFYCYNGKMCCYLWVHKKHGVPYLGIVEGAQINHPQLLQEKRARMKIFLIDPAKDIPIKTIKLLLKDIIALYRH